LKTISGAVDPQKGTIVFLGAQIQKRDPDDVVRMGISHVPEGREVFPLLTVHENLMMGAHIVKNKAQIEEDLRKVHHYFPILKERQNQKALYLSGGEQQMLAIGRGLMSRPKLLLLDEPSLGLSPFLVTEMLHIIKRLNTDENTTILLVEQNANLALRVAHHGYVLENGRIVMEDTCEKLMSSDDIKEFYMGIKDQGVRGRRRWKKTKTWR